MNIKRIKKEAEQYIEENKIERNSYQIEKAFIDGAKRVVKLLNIDFVSECTCANTASLHHKKKHGTVCKKCYGDIFFKYAR